MFNYLEDQNILLETDMMNKKFDLILDVEERFQRKYSFKNP